MSFPMHLMKLMKASLHPPALLDTGARRWWRRDPLGAPRTQSLRRRMVDCDDSWVYYSHCTALWLQCPVMIQIELNHLISPAHILSTHSIVADLIKVPVITGNVTHIRSCWPTKPNEQSSTTKVLHMQELGWSHIEFAPHDHITIPWI